MYIYVTELPDLFCALEPYIAGPVPEMPTHLYSYSYMRECFSFPMVLAVAGNAFVGNATTVTTDGE